jgi:flagellar M-ring protein FliF
MLRLRSGRSLSDAQVQAIIHLVASSISGLAPEDVSVVDQAGRLLSRAGGAGADDTGDRQVALQQRIEDRYRQTLASLLTPVVGDGNFTAEVHADLDFAEVALTRETYPKDGAVVAREEGRWTNDPSGGDKAATGIPGALSNVAPPAATATATANGQPVGQKAPQAPGTAPGQASAGATAKTEESYDRSYQLGHEVSVTRNPVGTVRRLSVAVALKQPAGGKPLTPQQQAQIEKLVQGAVGFDQQRGDVVAVTQQAFVVDPAAAGPSWYQAAWIGPVARNLTAIAVAAILVFGIGRPMMKRRAIAVEQKIANKAKERAQMGKEIQTALGSADVEISPDKPVTLDMIEAAPGYAQRAALIRNFVRQDPDRAALVVRDLIRADMKAPENA